MVPAFGQGGLIARWEHQGPLHPEAADEHGSRLQLHLENHGQSKLPPRGWSIYFNSAHVLDTDRDSPVTVEHLGGDFHRLRPAPTFQGIAAGAAVVLSFWSQSTLANISAAPMGAYLVRDGNPSRTFPVLSEVVRPFPPLKVEGFSSVEQLAADRFDWNVGITDIPAQDLPPVFPTPILFKPEAGELRLTGLPRITTQPELASESRLLASYLRPLFKSKPTRESLGILLETGEVEGLAGEEAYLLVIDPRKGIRIRGRAAAGVFYGIQTLRALLPIGTASAGVTLKAITIKDAPRFGYRGLHLDVARNFQPKASILRVLELMARYKLNAFHFHLTDDEGWRLEIRGIPELTAVGAVRGHTLTSERFLPPAYGSGPQRDRAFGSGFFSREDYKEILRHAGRLHIEVIPELEMPGHARAAIKAMEARFHALQQKGDSVGAARYRLADPGDTSEYSSAQNYHDNVMNPALPSTYSFISKVVEEVVALHREAGTPLKHLHMGGDEVPSGVWERSPMVQALLKKEGWATVDACWSLFYGRISEMLQSHGVGLSGWEEIALKKIQTGGNWVSSVNPAFATKGWRAYVWNNVPGWGNEDLAYQLANAGYQVVLCPVTNFYFDLAATTEPEEYGLRWGGVLDVDKPFDFIPLNYYRSTRQDHLGRPLDPKVFEGKVRLSEKGRGNILGIQGCLWSETLTEEGRLEHMLVPKLLGLAERAWAPDPAWAGGGDGDLARRLHQEALSQFLNILGKRELVRMAREVPGVRFRIPAPGLKVIDGRMYANVMFPGMTLRYTTDGTEPTGRSPIYSEALPARGTVKIAAFDASDRKGPTVVAVSRIAAP